MEARCGLCEKLLPAGDLVDSPGGVMVCPDCAARHVVRAEPDPPAATRTAPARRSPEDGESRSFVRAAEVLAFPTQLLAAFSWITSAISLLSVIVLMVRAPEGSRLVMVAVGFGAVVIFGLLGLFLWCLALWFVRFSQLLSRITLAVERRAP